MSELAASDDRVKVVNKIKNEGTHLARRTGVLNSTGDYIYLLDADDSLPDGCLKLLADAIAKTDADISSQASQASFASRCLRITLT